MKNFSEMDISTVQLFNNMTDDDFMLMHKVGKLKDLCFALSLDLADKVDNNQFMGEA
mgnify:CR=1 FL=1|jgi:hypothetical protein